MPSDRWRVVDTAGVVHEAPITAEADGLFEVRTSSGTFVSKDQHLLAVEWASRAALYLTEIVPPGELTKAEAVARETERCAAHVDLEAQHFRDNLAKCDGWITAGLRAVLAVERVESLAEHIRFGKEAPK